MAVLLLIMLVLRARRVLACLMLLTALMQTLDAITATATGLLGLVLIDLAFTAAFLVGAARLSPHPDWRAVTWREAEPSLPATSAWITAAARKCAGWEP